jgi:mannose/fructose/N-acetylgalactosamine-specific phosphotransferase system component IIC
MVVDWQDVGLAGAWGGLLALERRAFLQAMLSRPLVAATGMGLLLGEQETGLYIGMLLELFHLGSAALGAALPENETLAATGTTAAAACMATGEGGGGTAALWAVALILFAWLGTLGRLVDRRLERVSSGLADRALHLVEQGELDHAVRLHGYGPWPYVLAFSLLTAGCALGGFALSPVVYALPLPALRGLAWAFPAMACVAAALAARASHAQRGGLWATLAGAAVILVMLAAAWVAR